MQLRTTRTLAAVGIAATILGVGAMPASASVTTRHPVRAVHLTRAARGLAAQKARCTFEVDKRVFSLGLARIRVGQVRHLTDAQRATEQANIDAVSHNLETVNRPAIRNAATRAALDVACRATFLDNRVYAVVVPQLFAYYFVGADVVVLLDTLNANIATAKTAGKDTAAVEAVAAEARAHVDAALTAISTVTAEQYNADHAAVKTVFEHAATDLETGQALHRQAAHDLAAL